MCLNHTIFPLMNVSVSLKVYVSLEEISINVYSHYSSMTILIHQKSHIEWSIDYLSFETSGYVQL